ncbi:MAG: antitoxin family protein [Nitrospirae bacterium]|nr:antitoxin family protein [Nitrospirota bacterium]MBF0593302.1 antitoxin family protein [Nitrospirota bacterium]
MSTVIKATYNNGLIEPLEEVNLIDGTELTVNIPDELKITHRKNFLDALNATAGGWKDLIDCEQLIKDIYAEM